MQSVRTGDRAQERRLAGAVRPDERERLALLDLERHLAHRLQQAVTGVGALDREQAHAAAVPR